MQEQFRNSVTFFGKGVHYNKSTKMTVIPTSSGGIVFQRIDLNGEQIPATYTTVRQTQLNTTVTNGTNSVATIEHLMAAFYNFKLKNAIIMIDGAEVPLMDGGSNDFVFGLETLDIPPQNTQTLMLNREIKVEANGSHIIATPSETFEVSCEIDFQNSPIGNQKTIFHEEKHNFKDAASHAKTFGHIKQIEAMSAQGICLGGDIFSAIVFNDNEVISPSYTHNKRDFVRHKMLDFIGDIHITPFEIKGNFECYKSSHAMNNMLLREIFSNEQNYTIKN